MNMVNVKINNRQVSVPEGTSILHAAKKTGVTIPNLCYHPDQEVKANCRVCVVEVEGVNRLLPSCATKVTDGMVVNTRSEKVIESRKTALELLLSNHYADCIGPCEDNCPSHVAAQNYISLISKIEAPRSKRF